MSLTPSSRSQARYFAQLLERERANLAWWKQPAYEEPRPVAADPLALELWARYQARKRESSGRATRRAYARALATRGRWRRAA